MIWLVACTPDPVVTTPPAPRPTTPVPQPTSPVGVPLEITLGPIVRPPEAPEPRLVQLLEVSTSRPSRATVVLDDGVRRREITFPALATDHVLPLLELYEDTAYGVEVTLAAEDGEVAVGQASFATQLLPDLLPVRELLAASPDIEPGVRLLPCTGDEPSVDPMILGLDAEVRLVWAYASPADTRALSLGPDGVFAALVGGRVRRFDPAGGQHGVWALEAVADPGEIPVAVRDMHHEVVWEPDGSFWTFDKVPVEVDAFPTSSARPEVTAPATISDDQVVRIGSDGSVLERFSLAELLDEGRIGYDSLDGSSVGAYDWAHGNAIVSLPDEDAVIVSVRHQDTVAKFRRSTGELVWILANPDGWTAEHEVYRLTPVGADFAWQYHQHAPAIGPDGSLLLFDNGNMFRTTPYTRDFSGDLYTRVVQYAIDEARGEVSQVFATTVGGDHPLYTDALGNADFLPVTGHLLATFPWLLSEDGVANEDVGKGRKSVRLVEIDPADGAIVWDLRLYADAADSADGWQVDRGILVPTLYPADVMVRWLE